MVDSCNRISLLPLPISCVKNSATVFGPPHRPFTLIMAVVCQTASIQSTDVLLIVWESCLGSEDRGVGQAYIVISMVI